MLEVELLWEILVANFDGHLNGMHVFFELRGCCRDGLETVDGDWSDSERTAKSLMSELRPSSDIELVTV